MIRGQTASVELRQWGTRDGFGNDVESYAAPVEVGNVLVAPGSCQDLDATRPEGVRVSLTLHFPRTWTERLRGARVTLAGRYQGTYAVVGDPMPYMGENCPTAWSMPVEVEAVDG